MRSGGSRFSLFLAMMFNFIMAIIMVLFCIAVTPLLGEIVGDSEGYSRTLNIFLAVIMGIFTYGTFFIIFSLNLMFGIFEFFFYRKDKPVKTFMKVLNLIFGNLLSGICLFIDQGPRYGMEEDGSIDQRIDRDNI